MRIELLHLDGVHRGQSQEWADGPIRIGSDPAGHVDLSGAPGILPLHAEIVTESGEARLVARGPVRLNERPADEAVLHDGDEIALGDDVRLRLRLDSDESDRGLAFRRTVARAAPAAGTSPRAPAGTALASIATLLFFGVLLASAGVAGRGESADPETTRTLQAQTRHQNHVIAAQKRRIARLEAELGDLGERMAPRTEVEAHVGRVRRAVADVEGNLLDRVSTEIERSLTRNPDLEAARAAVRRIERGDSAASRVIAGYSASVCVIQGAYGFGKMVDGEWVFLREATGDLARDLDSASKVPLVLEGDGPLFKVEYVGTGFLVDADGIVLTNRHIAEPWWKSDAAAPLLEQGFTPRFLLLRGCFPGHRRALDFDRDRTAVSAGSDLAALRFRPAGPLPDPLPLANPDDVVVGRRVILLGYPSGLDAILARSAEGTAQRLSRDAGWDPARLLDALAERGLVRPLATQGHIGDIVGDKILFDAPTAVGGSGGPLLDLEGRVVGINYGILKAFSGANFGVAVHHATRLLDRLRDE